MTKPPKIPNVAWRDGRPRFMPGEPIRKLGYKGENLQHADGRWFSAGEALDWGTAKAAEIEALRTGLLAAANAKRPKKTPPLRHAPAVYTLARLFEDWQASPRWGEGENKGKRRQRPYSDNTRRDYRQKMRAIEAHDADLYASAVAALDQPILVGFYEEIWEAKGLATARGAIATLSAAISWGLRRGKVQLPSNPALKLGMSMAEPRVRFGERAEIAALYATADRLGRPEIGDMVALGLWTGQRQNDRLALVEHRSELMQRRMFRQKKTSAIVSVVEAPELSQRLAESRRRRREAGVINPHVVLDERRWQPFKADHYRHVFAEVRDVAAAGWMEGETLDDVLARAANDKELTARGLAEGVGTNIRWLLPPCPSVADFRDQDLRDTSVTWMAFGGATIPEIISVTGHTAESAHTILKHYLARHPELADAAIGKMVAWFERETNGERP